MPSQLITPGNSPYSFPFAGKTNITFIGRSADGSKTGAVNGGAAATFTGILTTDGPIGSGATGVDITIPTAGSEAALYIIDNAVGSGFVCNSGLNDGSGGSVVQDDYTWVASSTEGAALSITGVGSDGSVTMTWTATATGSQNSRNLCLMSGDTSHG